MDDTELSITADLAKLDLSEEERLRFAEEVQRMLSYFDIMANADSDPEEAPDVPIRAVGALREDLESRFCEADSLIDRGPEIEDRYIVIPNVL